MNGNTREHMPVNQHNSFFCHASNTGVMNTFNSFPFTLKIINCPVYSKCPRKWNQFPKSIESSALCPAPTHRDKNNILQHRLHGVYGQHSATLPLNRVVSTNFFCLLSVPPSQVSLKKHHDENASFLLYIHCKNISPKGPPTITRLIVGGDSAVV